MPSCLKTFDACSNLNKPFILNSFNNASDLVHFSALPPTAWLMLSVFWISVPIEPEHRHYVTKRLEQLYPMLGTQLTFTTAAYASQTPIPIKLG